MEIQQLIENIRNTDLSTYPHSRIKQLISESGNVGIIQTTFNPGKSIIRGRINFDNQSYNCVSALSYKPAKLNNCYYRASTPKESVFYGAIIPEYTKQEEINQAYLTVGFEISKFLRQKEKSGQLKLTFSKWDIVEPIEVISIVFHENYIAQTNLAEELNKGYDNYIQKYPTLYKNTIPWNNFIASEFAKTEVDQDWKYLISAIYTEIMFEKGYDGVLYPSVQMAGKGFNIALKPSCVDKKLSATLICESDIYKLKDKMILDWGLICQLTKNQKEITFEQDKLNEGIVNCWRILLNE